jgi:DNA-binding NarL/FixJ family response regulator
MMSILSRPIDVVIVEDDDACASRFEEAITAREDMRLQARFTDGTAAMQWLKDHQADVLLCDLGLPDMSGLAVIAHCARQFPDMSVMVITMYEDESHVVRSLEAGASGYLLKDSLRDEICDRIRELHAGGLPLTPTIARLVLKRFRPDDPRASRSGDSIQSVLTPRERVVLTRIAQGFSFLEIGRLEGISVNTVQTHVKHIYSKLSVGSRSEAVFEAQAAGLLELPLRPN